MTASDLINSALRLIGVLASGEVPTSAESSDALLILNQLIEAWTAERMMIFTLTITEFPLTVGQQTYTLGTGGNFNMARPARIERMGIVSFNNAAQPLELPLEMLTDQGWAAIPVKLISSSLPQKVYDDGAFPLRNLSFWCIPNVNVSTRIYAWTNLVQFPDLFTDETFPPGYAKALRYNLAVDLAPEFGRQVPPEVAVQAIATKAALKSINAPLVETRVDEAVSGSLGGAKRVYNWLTDGPASRG